MLGGCGYNTLQAADEQIKANWAEVVNQYQRRADLIPDLVETVKAFAGQERDVLLGVANARSKVGSIQATPEPVNDPQAFAQFTQAQGGVCRAVAAAGGRRELSAIEIGCQLPRFAGTA